MFSCRTAQKCSLTIHADIGLRLLLLLRLRGMLSEIDRRGRAEIEVEELSAGEELEVSVVEAEVVLSGLLFVRRNGVEVGQVGRHVRGAAGCEVGHGLYGWARCAVDYGVRRRRTICAYSVVVRVVDE